MFKTRLDTFGNDFGLFCNFEKFLIFFFENFPRLGPHGTLGKKNFWKKLTQNMFKTRLDIFENDFGHFCNFEKFFIILKIFEDSTFHGTTLGKKKFSKKLTRNMFKTRLDTFGNDFGLFWNFEKFLIFLKIFEDSTLMEHWAKQNFRKN